MIYLQVKTVKIFTLQEMSYLKGTQHMKFTKYETCAISNRKIELSCILRSIDVRKPVCLVCKTKVQTSLYAQSDQHLCYWLTGKYHI